MALNPYFLQGSPNEQNLVQDLINEHLRMFGIEVYYIPRKYIKTDNIIREVQSSKFDDTFLIEGYLNNYEGYSPGSDIMTKFGISLRNELTLTISRERFEDFISPILQSIIESDEENKNIDGSALFSTRPKEGDLIYFPLGQRLFEIKQVEFERPFYQLGKNYIYELQCELFEYEDEEIDTDIPEIDDRTKDIGYITTLTLVGLGSTAYGTALVAPSGSVEKVYLNNDGYGFISTPTVSISAPQAGGIRATAVAITTSIGKNKIAIKEIALTNAGYGYTTPPTVTITGGGGAGAAATCGINTGTGIYTVVITSGGSNYYRLPEVTFSSPSIGTGTTAIGIASISNGQVKSVLITNSGFGYTNPTVTFSSPPIVGVGTFRVSEKITGQTSGTEAIVKSWIDTGSDIKILKIQINNGTFYPGEVVLGSESSASYLVKEYSNDDTYNAYNQNEEFELEADKIIDFSESNPFGTY
jgi:hypothetical protein